MQLAGKILQKYDRTAFRNLHSGFQYTPQGSYQQGHQQMYQQTYQNKSPEQQPNQPQQHNPKNFAQNQLNPQQQRYFESQQHQQQRTQTSMNNSTREFNEADLQKLQKLFKISSRVKISDVEQIANLERAQIINILIENSENLKGIKIEGDELVVEKEGDVSNFMDVLDTQFDGWEQREHNKEGKVEEFGNWEE